jgi:Ribbon-helix-helix protein, copG family
METKRFTARIEYLEEPLVADQLQREAIRNATSVAAVIRQAVRQALEAKR